MKRRYLSAAEVAQPAELLEDAPRRVGVIDRVLEAAAAGRGMTLLLGPLGTTPRDAVEQPLPGSHR